MFNNKKDPLVDSVKAVMEANSKRRDAESRVNEAFGVTSKRGLPHELHADYDAALQKATEVALKEGVEALDEVSKKKVYDALERAYDPDDDDPKRIATGDRIADKASKKWGKKVGEKLRTKAIDSHYPTNEEIEQVDEGRWGTDGPREYEIEKAAREKDEKEWAEMKAKKKSTKDEKPSQIKESFEHFLRNKFLKD